MPFVFYKGYLFSRLAPIQNNEMQKTEKNWKQHSTIRNMPCVYAARCMKALRETIFPFAWKPISFSSYIFQANKAIQPVKGIAPGLCSLALAIAFARCQN